LLAGILIVASGCGGDDTGTTGAGGGTGGSAGAGTGGTTGTGGSVGTGGTTGTGGSVGTGGIPGTGGSVGTGGTTGTGGAPVSDAAVVCALPVYTNVFRFVGSTSDGWGINQFSNPPSLFPGTNVETGAMTGTLLEVDRNNGNPAPGPAKLTIPFDGPAEQLIFQQLLSSGTAGVNLGGTTISAQVRLDSLAGGAVASIVQGAIAIKSTAGYTYAQGPSVNLQEGSWVTVSMPTDSAVLMNSIFDTCDVREVDVLLLTGASGTYGTAVVHVDTIAFTAGDAGVPPEGDGGAANPDASLDGGAGDAPSTVDAAGEAETGSTVPPDAAE
jgi:hypothetical protein